MSVIYNLLVCSLAASYLARLSQHVLGAVWQFYIGQKSVDTKDIMCININIYTDMVGRCAFITFNYQKMVATQAGEVLT